MPPHAVPTGIGDFNSGIRWAIFIIFLTLIGLTSMELVLEWCHLDSIGNRVQHWAKLSPVLAAFLLGILALFLGHFFGNQIRFLQCANC